MYICIYIYIYICRRSPTRGGARVQAPSAWGSDCTFTDYTFRNSHVHVCMCVCVCMCTCIHACVCVCVCVCVVMCIRICTCICMCTCVCIRTSKTSKSFPDTLGDFPLHMASPRVTSRRFQRHTSHKFTRAKLNDYMFRVRCRPRS